MKRYDVSLLPWVVLSDTFYPLHHYTSYLLHLDLKEAVF